jgi:peptidoglycan/LPS O-acetylase OafA/YrhL
LNPAGRNEWIDALRALSAMAVALFHYNVVPQVIPPGAWAQGWHACWLRGHWGVGVFFALSGYCLIPGWLHAAGGGSFLRHRLWRILPPYWCSLLLVAGLAVGFKLVTGVNQVVALPHTVWSFLATVFLLTDPVTPVPTINWVYWTLSFLLAFSLLLSLVQLVPARARIHSLAGLHGLLCTVDLAHLTSATGVFFFIRHWPVFGLGAALALWPLHRRAAGVMLAISALHFFSTMGRDAVTTTYIMVGGVSVGLVAGIRHWRLPSWLRLLSKAGIISYSLYLVQVPVGIYTLFRFLPASYGTASAYIGSQLAWLAVTLAAAGMFYFVGERPFSGQPRLNLRP